MNNKILFLSLFVWSTSFAQPEQSKNENSSNVPDYIQELEELRTDSSAYSDIEKIQSEALKVMKEVEEIVNYNRQLKAHLDDANIQASEDIAWSKDFLSNYDENLALAKKKEILFRKGNLKKRLAEIKERCRSVENNQLAMTEHCSSIQAKMNSQISVFDNLIQKYDKKEGL